MTQEDSKVLERWPYQAGKLKNIRVKDRRLAQGGYKKMSNKGKEIYIKTPRKKLEEAQYINIV